jgi:hypothetical protein
LRGAAIGAASGFVVGKIVKHERERAYEEAYYDVEYRGQYPVAHSSHDRGYVVSPYPPHHLIDVRGIPSGGKVSIRRATESSSIREASPRLLAGFVLAAATASADVPKGIYRGSSQTTVKFLDPVTLAVTSTRRYSRKLTVTIAKHLVLGSSTEANPFYFAIAPTNTSPLTAGDFFTASARTAAVNGTDDAPAVLADAEHAEWIQWNVWQCASARTRSARPDRCSVQDPGRYPQGASAVRLQLWQHLSVTATGLVTGTSMTLSITGYARAGKLADLGNNAIITFQTSITAQKK